MQERLPYQALEVAQQNADGARFAKVYTQAKAFDDIVDRSFERASDHICQQNELIGDSRVIGLLEYERRPRIE